MTSTKHQPGRGAEAPHPSTVLPEDTIESADTIRMPGPLRKVYRFFISKRTGIGLILAMGVLTLLGTMLPQSTESMRSDPQSYQVFLDGVRPRFRGWTNILDALYLFDVFGSPWFKAVNVLLCISILCCVLHRLPLLVKRATRPNLHVTEPFFSHASIHHDLTSPKSADEAMTLVRGALGKARYRVLDDPKGPGKNVYADRFRWMPFGTIFAHIAFVIILLGVLITANTGFSEDNFPVAIGDTREVGHGTGLSVRATSFSDTYYPDGRPKDYVSHLQLLQDGKVVKEQDTRVNEPLRHDGVKVFQSSFGFAARVKITDSDGTVLYSGGVPLQYTTDDKKNSFGKIELPAKNVDVFVVTAASGATDSQLNPGEVAFKVQPPKVDRTIGQEIVSQGQSAKIDGLTYTFERELQYTGLMVSDDPGALWVWIGSAMILIGMTVTMFLRHRRLWVRVYETPTGSRVRLASSERHDTAYEGWVGRFVEDLGEQLDATPTDHTVPTRTTVGA